MPSSDAPQHPPHDAAPVRGASSRRRIAVLVGIVLGWTYLYNVGLKGQSPVQAFFRLLDTLSDDFLAGALLTVAIGLGIVVVFSLTKLYSQIVANAASFRLLEIVLHEGIAAGEGHLVPARLLSFSSLLMPARCCPLRVSSMLLSLCFIYLMSWVGVVVFSEALFFASWSSGVNLPINEHNVLMMPTLALGIPFSARVMAYLRYPYAQDFADLMPAATFVLLLVTMLGVLFESPDQQFFLVRVFADPKLAQALLLNGVYLAFIPVFAEAAFWLLELARRPPEEPGPVS